MTLPRLDGWYDEIKDSIPQIVGGVRSLINPNYQNDDALREAIKRDPSVLQKLRDMEANSPGLLARTYGKGTTGNIMGLGESAENQQSRLLTSARSEVLSDPQAAKDIAGADVVTARTGQEELKKKGSDARVAVATEQNQIDLAGYQTLVAGLQADEFKTNAEKETARANVRDLYKKSGRSSLV
jgi:microcompartment protein CcmK/EutM